MFSFLGRLQRPFSLRGFTFLTARASRSSGIAVKLLVVEKPLGLGAIELDWRPVLTGFHQTAKVLAGINDPPFALQLLVGFQHRTNLVCCGLPYAGGRCTKPLAANSYRAFHFLAGLVRFFFLTARMARSGL